MDSVSLPRSIYDTMHADVARRSPEEACGLLGGRFEGAAAIVTRCWALTNRLHSPVRFQIDPLEQLQVFDALEAEGLELVGIYHSHPCGPDHPSATDIAEAYYPEAASLIWSDQEAGWQLNAFHIMGKQSHPLFIQFW